MRRTYISPEYDSNNINGTFDMLEQSNFFGSKMLQIEEQINIDNNDIIWYQKKNNEQLDFSIESSLESNFYSSSDNKKNNHKLSIDETQTQFRKEVNTRWILQVDISSILQNYIFSSMKKYRAFEGLKNEMTIYNDVDVALNEYIKINVIDRYRFSKIELFIEHKDLRNDNVLRYNNVWNQNISSKDNLLNRFQQIEEVPNSLLKLVFEQRPSSEYTFEYYFNVIFDKI